MDFPTIDGFVKTNVMPDIGDRCFGWWLSDLIDDSSISQERQLQQQQPPEHDSGVFSGEMFGESISSEGTTTSYVVHDIPSVEIATDVLDRTLTPEGNVKYKNYRILAPTNLPIRVYSPLGDVNTTPAKNKIVPKFIHEDSSPPRDKITTLIDKNCVGSTLIEEIVNTSTPNRRKLEQVRLTNAMMQEYDQEVRSSKNSSTTDVWNSNCPVFKFEPDQSKRAMTLRDEMLFANYNSGNSLTSSPFKLRSSPVSSSKLSYGSYDTSSGCTKTAESIRTSNLTVVSERLKESSFECSISTCNLVKDIHSLEEAIRGTSRELAVVQYQFMLDENHVQHLILSVKQLSCDLQEARYLDDVIVMLRGDLQELKPRRWPFRTAGVWPPDGTNLIV